MVSRPTSATEGGHAIASHILLQNFLVKFLQACLSRSSRRWAHPKGQGGLAVIRSDPDKQRRTEAAQMIMQVAQYHSQPTCGYSYVLVCAHTFFFFLSEGA